MTVSRRFLLIFTPLLLTAASTVGQNVHCSETEGVCRDGTSQPTSNALLDDCTLYLAPSSIPNAGWGVYVGTSFQKGQVIPPLDLVIQVQDFLMHNKHRQAFSNETLPDWLLNRLSWNSAITGAKYDGSDMSIIPSFGMLANNHPTFVNIVPFGITNKQIVDRNSPQAGAFSEYKGMAFVAKQDIPVGH